jgi:hypothetical protein
MIDMATPLQNAAALWKQHAIPVVYRPEGREPLLVHLPYRPDNGAWLRGQHRRRPAWVAQYKGWQAPKAWFDDVVSQCLLRFGHVYVIQPYRVQETCAPACWQAHGFTCECSCLGANHGCQQPAGQWHIVSETCAIQWHGRQLACRLLTHA